MAAITWRSDGIATGDNMAHCIYMYCATHRVKVFLTDNKGNFEREAWRQFYLEHYIHRHADCFIFVEDEYRFDNMDIEYELLGDDT